MSYMALENPLRKLPLADLDRAVIILLDMVVALPTTLYILCVFNILSNNQVPYYGIWDAKQKGPMARRNLPHTMHTVYATSREIKPIHNVWLTPKINDCCCTMQKKTARELLRQLRRAALEVTLARLFRTRFLG